MQGRDRFGAWLARRLPEVLPEAALRELAHGLCERDAPRRILVDVLLHRLKDGAPPLAEMPFDLPPDGALAFEDLAGLFASTTLDEFIVTMNLRQTAYLFGLLRRMRAERVIEVGRHWGGVTLVIAAAMAGRGRFWSLDSGALDRYLAMRGQRLERPIEEQVAELARRHGLCVELVEGDPRTVEIDTGPVDLVFIDGEHAYEAARSDFERFGTRLRPGGALLLDDAVEDPFHEPWHTADVKRLVREIAERPDFRWVRSVRRLAHLERIG